MQGTRLLRGARGVRARGLDAAAMNLMLRVRDGGGDVVAPRYGRPIMRQLGGYEGAACTRGAHFLRGTVKVQMEAGETTLEMVAGDDTLEPNTAATAVAVVPMARARASDSDLSVAWFGRSVECPADALFERGVELTPRHPHPKVGAVIIPRHDGRVLLTRRAPHMRTFPRAWVFPGGAVDPGETAAEAAVRELKEETGLEAIPGSVRLVAVWESVFPTNVDACIARGQIAGHAVAMYFTADVRDPAALVLQEAEADAALWVPDGAWLGVCGGREEAGTPALTAEQRAQLHGIYPNDVGEGVAQGHLFALDTIFSLSEAMERHGGAGAGKPGANL